MGQYHEIWAFGEGHVAETVDPYALGAGAKLAEQAYDGSPYLTAVVGLLATRWAGMKVIVIGDYAEVTDEDVLASRGNPWREEMPLHWYYGAADRDDRNDVKIIDATPFALDLLDGKVDFTDSTLPPRRNPAGAARPFRSDWKHIARNGIEPGNFRFVCKETGESTTSAVEAYAMLAISDGRGGGDFGLDPAGRWAYTRLSVEELSDVSLNA